MLKGLNQESEIIFKHSMYDEMYPDELISYRGYYDRLAITTRSEPNTVGRLYQSLQDVIGKQLEGYKGGLFTMYEHTAVYVDDYGRSNGIIPVRVNSVSDNYELELFEVPYEYY